MGKFISKLFPIWDAALKTAPHSRELDHVSLLKWPAEGGGDGGRGGKGSENQSTPLSACGPSASHRLVVLSLPLFGSSHKSIDVPDAEAGFDC